MLELKRAGFLRNFFYKTFIQDLHFSATEDIGQISVNVLIELQNATDCPESLTLVLDKIENDQDLQLFIQIFTKFISIVIVLLQVSHEFISKLVHRFFNIVLFRDKTTFHSLRLIKAASISYVSLKYQGDWKVFFKKRIGRVDSQINFE